MKYLKDVLFVLAMMLAGAVVTTDTCLLDVVLLSVHYGFLALLLALVWRELWTVVQELKG